MLSASAHAMNAKGDDWVISIKHASHIRHLSSTEEAGRAPLRRERVHAAVISTSWKRPGHTPALHSRTTASLAGHIVPDDHVAIGEHVICARRHRRAVVHGVHPAGSPIVLFFGKPADSGNIGSARSAARVDRQTEGAQRIVGRGTGIERIRSAGGNRIADSAAGNRNRHGDDVRCRRLLASGAGSLRSRIALRRGRRLRGAGCGGAGIRGYPAAVAVSS